MNTPNGLEIYCTSCKAGVACSAPHQALLGWLLSNRIEMPEHEKAKRNREAARERALRFDRKRHGIAQAKKAAMPHSGPLTTMQAKLREALVALADKQARS